jgi:hypothetical protein
VIDVTDAAASRGTAPPSDGVVLALADLERQRVERLAGASRSRPTPADASAADLGHVALGALFVAQDRARDAVGLVRSAGVRLAPPARRMWASRPVAPVRAMVDERLQQLDARGRVEEQLSRRAGSRAFTQVVDGVTQSDEVIGIVDEVVDKVIGPVLDTTLPLVFDRLRSEQDAEALVALVNDIVDRVLGPVLDTALPVVMNRLNEDPSAVRDLVRDQSTSIAGELADSVRTRTVTADDRLERLVNRFRPSRRGEDARP